MPPSSPEQYPDYLARRRRGSGCGCDCSLAFPRLTGMIRAAARFASSSRADLAMRGFAISFMMLASVTSPNSFLAFSFIVRSEEHTSELQSHSDLVCRLLLEKKNNERPPELASDDVQTPDRDAD